MTRDLGDIVRIYDGSNGDATTALYAELKTLGIAGEVAVNLFRATKTSSRAKVYRGGRGGRSHKALAYDRKQWSLKNLADILAVHAAGLAIVWGWKLDQRTEGFPWVLYVDLPHGQVSFHSPVRGEGPDYPRDWDGLRGMGPDRVCRFVHQLLAARVIA